MKKRLQNLLKLASLEILATGFVFLLSLFILSLIIHEAVYEKEDAFDNRVIRFFAGHASPAFIGVMERITFFGSTTFLLPAYLVLIAWLIFEKKTQFAVDTAIIGITSTSMMFALKQFFHRHRPELPIIKGISGYSFPSGHALSSFIFCMILVQLVRKETLSAPLKYTLLFLLLLYPLAVGLSRIVLNVHYATDVIGGFCFAVVWVIISFALLKTIRKKTNTAGGSVS